MGRRLGGPPGDFIISALHLISSLMLLLLLEALEPEGKQRRQQKQPPTSLPSLLLCCRQHRKCLRWCRGRAMMPSITSASDGSGIGSDERRCRLHSASVAAARPLPKTAAGWWRVAADDRKRNLFWSKPQLDRDQDHGVS